MKYHVLFVILLLLLAGCKKEPGPEPQIMEPGPYFPVYPGSWWKYIVDDTLISIDSTSDDYVVHSFKIDAEPDRFSEPARVPLLNGMPIYRYDYVENIGYPSTIYQGIYELWPILSEQVGKSFSACWSDPRQPYPTELVTVISKTFNGTDSVLFLESGWTNAYQYPHYLLPEIRYRTFKKGIGLTSDIMVNSETSDTLSKKILIDYFVNHTF